MNIIEKLDSYIKENLENAPSVTLRLIARDILGILEEYKNAQEPVEYQIKILGDRWTHCAKHLYSPNNPNTRALFTNPPLSDETVKDGYVMVPRVPTPEMINAGVMVDRKAWEFGIDHYDRTRSTEALVHNLNRCTDAYKAMIEEAMKAYK